MLVANNLLIRPFLGIITAVDPRDIPDNAAQDARNVRVGDGRLRRRLGWVQVSAAQVGFTAAHGLFLLRNNTGLVADDEYVFVQTISGNTRPWSINPSTGARTEIKNDGVSLALGTGDWMGLSFDGMGYAWRAGGAEGAYRHDIGDMDDFALVDQARPAVPLSIAVAFSGAGLISSPLTPATFAGATGANVLYKNDAGPNRTTTFNSVSGDAILLDLQFTNSVPAEWEVRLQFPGAPLDWSTATKISFVIQWPSTEFDIIQMGGAFIGTQNAPTGVRIKNADGSPIELNLDVTYTLSTVGATHACAVTATFPSGATMSDWDNVDEIWIGFQTDGSGIGGTGTYTINQIFAYAGASPTPSADAIPLKFGLAAYDSLRGAESELLAESAVLQLDMGKKWFSIDDLYLGTNGTVTGPTLASPATAYRLYVQTEEEGLWRLVASGTDGDLTLDFDFIISNIAGFPVRGSDLGANPIGPVRCACAYGGWVVWGTDSGRGNIRHSRVGQPVQLNRVSDLVEDLNRGATFTLSEDFTDRPVWMGDAGQALVILGQSAAYVQTGQYPSSMTPTRRLAQSKGVYGPRSACRFRDSIGNPGVAYISKEGHLFFLVATQVDPDGEYGFQISWIGEVIRDQIRSFLGGGSMPNASRLYVMADEVDDSLVIAYDGKAIVLDKRMILNGQRPFVFHEFGVAWHHWAPSERWGLRSVRSTGAFDELWRSPSGTEYTTDNGSAITGAFWKSKTFATPDIRRTKSVRVARESLADPVSVTIVSNRGTRTLNVAAGDEFEKSWIDTMGREISYQINLGPAGTPINELHVYETGPVNQGQNQ